LLAQPILESSLANDHCTAYGRALLKKVHRALVRESFEAAQLRYRLYYGC